MQNLKIAIAYNKVSWQAVIAAYLVSLTYTELDVEFNLIPKSPNNLDIDLNYDKIYLIHLPNLSLSLSENSNIINVTHSELVSNCEVKSNKGSVIRNIFEFLHKDKEFPEELKLINIVTRYQHMNPEYKEALTYWFGLKYILGVSTLSHLKTESLSVIKDLNEIPLHEINFLKYIGNKLSKSVTMIHKNDFKGVLVNNHLGVIMHKPKLLDPIESAIMLEIPDEVKFVITLGKQLDEDLVECYISIRDSGVTDGLTISDLGIQLDECVDKNERILFGTIDLNYLAGLSEDYMRSRDQDD